MSASASERWVAAGICLCRIAAVTEDSVSRALPWLSAVLTELGALPPPGVIIDIALLLAGEPLDTSHGTAIDHPRLRAAVSTYEDRVLGRLAADRRLQPARDAYAALEPRLRPHAVAVTVARLVQGSTELTTVESGALRKLSRRPAKEVIAEGFDVWREPGEVFDRLAAGYEALTVLARGARTLLSGADVFTLENLSVLSEMGQRLAIAQIVDAAEAMQQKWPRRVKLERRDLGPAPTALEDESAYPAGGFTSVATHGALENLVTSELVYMDDDAERGEGVDLFDVRYAEGELLYYTRDEALIVRPRRIIAFVLHHSLTSARLKDPDLPWQRGVILLAWVLAAVRRLERWLGESELRFLCIFERDDRHLGALAREREILELLLTEWRDKGTAEVLVSRRDDWLSQLSNEAKRADVRVAVLGVDADVPVEDARVLATSFGATARDWDTWCSDGLTALRTLV